MLQELKVSNFAIIDNVHMVFQNGLNILSGETGAGKSILLKSLALLMGEKASIEAVRTGAEQATIEGSFDISERPDVQKRLKDLGIDAQDGNLIVRRLVAAQNKSRIYLNGSLSTLTSLREVVAPLVEVAGPTIPLIEMTGQHENRNLLSRSYHLDLLDQFSGAWKQRPLFAQKFAEAQALRAEIESLQSDARNRAQRLDFLIYQRDEISALDLRVGEEEEIENETKRLKYAAKLSDFVSQAEDMISGSDDSVTSRLHYVLQRASDLKSVDPTLAQRLEPLSQAKALISEVSYELRDYAKSLEGDPSRLEELADRLNRLRQLQRKYGTTAAEILTALSEIETEIGRLENSDNLISEQQAKLASIEQDLLRLAKEMHKSREGSSKLFEKEINGELKDLNMKGLTFLVKVTWTEQMNSSGQSEVEFLSQTSKTDAPRPLAKFASGGELSRILLSIKQVVGGSGYPRTYLFDEVDTGVSGETAEKVGRKLKSIAKDQQVICVTHLPQVAAFGDSHFYIHKSSGGKSVNMEVTELQKKDRVQEIARLISGEKITKTSVAHAEQLLAEAH